MSALLKIAETIANNGGRLYYVGGYVRDSILGIENEDIDLAVEGLSFQKLIECVRPYASKITEEAVGGTFAVVKAVCDDIDLDFALCRGEKKVGNQHTSFALNFNVSIYDDLMRRDLTINAIAKDVLTGTMLDPYNGIIDLQNGVAREVSTAFAEDPLRVMRAARFIARFNLKPTESLISMAKSCSYLDISPERFGQEVYKMVKQAVKPSAFFHFLNQVGWLEAVMPELHALIGINQNPKYHPEGEAFTHTMLCVDNSQDWRTRLVMIGHDLGKATTTKLNSSGNWSHHGHELQSISLASNMFHRMKLESFIGGNKELDKVICLIEQHMLGTIPEIGNTKLIKRIRKLKQLGLDFEDLYKVILADYKGAMKSEFDALEQLATRVKALEAKGVFTPIVTGKMLVAKGVKAGKSMGILLAKLQDLQDQGILTPDNWEEFIQHE